MWISYPQKEFIMQKTYYTSSMLSNSQKAFVAQYEAYHHMKSGEATETEIAAAHHMEQNPLLVKILEHKVEKLIYEKLTAKISIEEYKAQMSKYKESEPEMLKEFAEDIAKLFNEPIHNNSQ